MPTRRSRPQARRSPARTPPRRRPRGSAAAELRQVQKAQRETGQRLQDVKVPPATEPAVVFRV